MDENQGNGSLFEGMNEQQITEMTEVMLRAGDQHRYARPIDADQIARVQDEVERIGFLNGVKIDSQDESYRRIVQPHLTGHVGDYLEAVRLYATQKRGQAKQNRLMTQYRREVSKVSGFWSVANVRQKYRRMGLDI